MGFFGGGKKEEQDKKTTEQPQQNMKKQPEPEVKQPEKVVVKQQQTSVAATTQQTQVQEEFNIAEYVNMLKFWNYPEYIQYKDQAFNEVLIPSVKYYEVLPYKMTEFKRDYILEYIGSQSNRSIALGLSTILITMGSMKVQKGLRKTLRNTVLGFFGLGLFILPEVYNPFIVQPKRNQN